MAPFNPFNPFDPPSLFDPFASENATSVPAPSPTIAQKPQASLAEQQKKEVSNAEITASLVEQLSLFEETAASQNKSKKEAEISQDRLKKNGDFFIDENNKEIKYFYNNSIRTAKILQNGRKFFIQDKNLPASGIVFNSVDEIRHAINYNSIMNDVFMSKRDSDSVKNLVLPNEYFVNDSGTKLRYVLDKDPFTTKIFNRNGKIYILHNNHPLLNTIANKPYDSLSEFNESLKKTGMTSINAEAVAPKSVYGNINQPANPYGNFMNIN